MTETSLDDAASPLIYDVDEAIADAHRILDEAEAYVQAEGKRLVARCILFSGGNDSSTLLHLVRHRADYAVHVNTTIGVEETHQYVRDTAAAMGLPLIEAFPPHTYRDLVTGRARQVTDPSKPIWSGGFPGPPAHGIMFTWLKERALRTVRRDLVKHPRQERVLFIAGTRLDESKRRFRNVTERDVEGSTVWVSPIAHWSTRALNDYRLRFAVPRNEVSDLIHMSGECLCGAFAHKGELEELRVWFPNTAATIDRLQEEVREALPTARGQTWGAEVPPPNLPAPGRLCGSCGGEDDVPACPTPKEQK